MPDKTVPRRAFLAIVGGALLLLGIYAFFRFTTLGSSVLWSVSSGGRVLLPLVVISALIDSINPCAFSILLLTIAFLFSLGRSRSSVLAIGGTYVFGIFLAYFLIGLGILQALHLFSTPHFMAKAGAALLIGWGFLGLVNHFFPKFPLKLRIPQIAHAGIAAVMQRATLPAALALGVLVGLCEFPCTGGPYLLVLGLLHDAQTYVSGIGYLALYNIVFVTPLLLVLGIASSELFVAKVRLWQKEHARAMRLWGSIAMVVLGALIFFL